MDDVEHMSEGILRLLGDQGEFLEERVLSNCVRLCHNQVVAVWEARECMLQEIFGAGIEGCFHTEESNSECILGLFRRIRNGLQVTNISHNFVVFSVLTEQLFMLFGLFGLNTGLRILLS